MSNAEKKRVLVIDDESDITEALEYALGMRGYAVELANNRATIEARMRAFDPHVVIMDYCIPDLGAQELVGIIRSRRPNAEIILITAMGNAPAKASELGLSHFLAKPFELKDMFELVEQCLECKRA